MGKLKHHSIRGVACSQFWSLKREKTIFGPIFLLYINDLQFCKAYHFADDTNLLYISKSIKKSNKLVNFDFKNLTNWLNANEMSLNVS